MSGIEIIGFVVSILSLLFLYFRNRYDNRYREEHPEEFNNKELIEEDDEEEEHLRNVLHNLALQRQEKKQPAPRPLPPSLRQADRPKSATFSEFDEYRLVSPIEKRQMHSAIENRTLKSKLASREISSKLAVPLHHHDEKEIIHPSKARKAISRLSHLPDIVIFTEILNPPKSLRPE